MFGLNFRDKKVTGITRGQACNLAVVLLNVLHTIVLFDNLRIKIIYAFL
jgi:hypothetical protein